MSPGAAGEVAACPACLRRTRLVELLSPHIERARHDGTRLPALLALGEERLLDALAGGRRAALAAELGRFEPAVAARHYATVGVSAFCRHDPRYPARLLDAADAPAVLHVAGDPAMLVGLAVADEERPAVGIVGARRATGYGREVAHSLGRGLAAAGVVVVSGMAMGVDAAAHEGALAVDGPTVAVLAGAPNVPYPAMKRALHAHLLRSACVVSEMPPGFRARRWSFPARNRIIAALTGMTVVVEATERSGSLITADIALQLGRAVGAVPGPVSSPLSAGANALLHDGAQVIRDAQDVLDAALPIGWSRPPAQADERARGDRCGGVGHQHLTGRATLPGAARPTVAPELSRVLELVDDGLSTAGAVAARLGDVTQATVSLTRLELLGVLRRERDGRYVRRLL